MGLPYTKLPLFIIQNIGRDMTIEDKLSFMATSQRVERAMLPLFRTYKILQISDELSETFLQENEDGPRYSFPAAKLPRLLSLCTSIEHLSIAIRAPFSAEPQKNGTSPIVETLFPGCQMYGVGGYIGQFWTIAPECLLQNLKTFSLTVDLVCAYLRHVPLPLPFHDLYFAISNFKKYNFTTSIQIGICATEEPTVQDIPAVIDMKENLKWVAWDMKNKKHKVNLELDDYTGYNDVTVEADNIDYSLGFFYFNPDLCEPEDDNKPMYNTSS
ncbi:unnamed protein product [Bursaphelenchus okinawaensis]|uniref:Uncharacterized protein n=1 Tax=Bursaphelenchus okinawaensis TaxID=465554 RepID=A0A811LAK6_9BILA|nr:unnamed protein product [Bursaphelenchus okinawaensis]CAG9120028.1 unnamed protein product [Bursaphelenchus okinawaensis]